MKPSKEEARRIVYNGAKQYKKNLLGKRFIIIYKEKEDNTIRHIIMTFYERNYQHLTGLELLDREGNVLQHQSVNFFRKCISNKLGLDEFRFRQDGTTPLKLATLPSLMDVTKITKITGDYNNRRTYLFAEKVIGGVNFCLGLSKDSDIYVPSSALLENIKKLTDSPSQVLGILEKDAITGLYSIIKHVAKGVNLSQINLPPEINSIIDLKDYVYKGK